LKFPYGSRAYVFRLGASKRCYNSWEGMHRRCYHQHNAKYKHYGGRGITICKRWHRDDPKSFENFYRDMGNPPAGLSLDRIDVNGNYEPSNCRWADKITQARSRRKIGSLSYFSPEEIGEYLQCFSEEQLMLILKELIRKNK
jgi:hypothetical protein